MSTTSMIIIIVILIITYLIVLNKAIINCLFKSKSAIVMFFIGSLLLATFFVGLTIKYLIMSKIAMVLLALIDIVMIVYLNRRKL